MGYINNQVPSVPNQMLVEGQLDDFETNVDNPIRIALEDNDLWDWTPQAPVRIMYCDGDDQVNYQNAVVAYERFVDNGAPDVQSFNFGPFNHGDCVLFCLIAGAWRCRFAGAQFRQFNFFRRRRDDAFYLHLVRYLAF
jgi:hypothetical protein